MSESSSNSSSGGDSSSEEEDEVKLEDKEEREESEDNEDVDKITKSISYMTYRESLPKKQPWSGSDHKVTWHEKVQIMKTMPTHVMPSTGKGSEFSKESSSGKKNPSGPQKKPNMDHLYAY